MHGVQRFFLPFLPFFFFFLGKGFSMRKAPISGYCFSVMLACISEGSRRALSNVFIIGMFTFDFSFSSLFYIDFDR